MKQTLEQYNKKIKDEKDKKQFKYTLSKNIFFMAVVMLLFKFVYFYKMPVSLFEIYLKITIIFLFIVSFFIFMSLFTNHGESCEDYDEIDFDDD